MCSSDLPAIFLFRFFFLKGFLSFYLAECGRRIGVLLVVCGVGASDDIAWCDDVASEDVVGAPPRAVIACDVADDGCECCWRAVMGRTGGIGMRGMTIALLGCGGGCVRFIPSAVASCGTSCAASSASWSSVEGGIGKGAFGFSSRK